MDRSRLVAPGLWMMAFAPLVASMRAVLALLGADEPSYYWLLFAVGGTLSGAGMILAAVGTFRRPGFWWVVAGAAVALVGHNLVPRVPVAAVARLGPSLVHVGTGTVLRPWQPWSLAAGVVAAAGAWLRHDHWAGQALLLVGAAGLSAAAVAGGRTARRR